MSEIKIEFKVYSDIEENEYDNKMLLFYDFDDDDSSEFRRHVTMQVMKKTDPKECIWVDIYEPEINHLISFLKNVRREMRKPKEPDC